MCRDRYKNRKSTQKKFFIENGGYDDVENARKHPPPSVRKDVWDKTVDHFLDPKFRNRSEKNAGNRAKARFLSLHGSSSYVSSRYKQKNPATQELPSLIDNWRKMPLQQKLFYRTPKMKKRPKNILYRTQLYRTKPKSVLSKSVTKTLYDAFRRVNKFLRHF